MATHQEIINYFDGYGSNYDDLIIRLVKRDEPMMVSGESVSVKAFDVEKGDVVTFTNCYPCPKCEKWILGRVNFCSFCGQRIEKRDKE